MRWLLLAGWLAACSGGDEAPEPVQYEVVRGDTLSKIAKRHGVTVNDLRTWNGIQGDLIEVGQVLLLHIDGGGTTPTAAPKRTRKSPSTKQVAAPPPSHDAGLVMPPEKACLSGPSAEGLDDEGMAASAGLTRSQIRGAVDAFLPRVTSCVTDDVPSKQIWLEINVACTGRVASVHIADQAGWPTELAQCVADRFRYAAFPAHDLPDGETFSQPIGFAP